MSKKGGRPATGHLDYFGGRWNVRVTLADGSRSPWIALDPSIPESDKERARAGARLVSDKVRGDGNVRTVVKETVAEYAKRWLEDRDGRVNSIRDDRSRMRLHVLPTLGPLSVEAVTRDDVERFRDELDRRIRVGELSWKTVASVWTLATSMCGDMVSAKRREFRVRSDNPCRDVKPPERGARKAKQYLWPSEFLQVVTCPKLSLRKRRAIALAVYLYARDGELRALSWEDGDIDLAHGVLSITRAYNQNAKAIRPTKTGHTRRFSIEPTLMPLLRAMHRESGGTGPVLMLPSDRDMARNLRRWLWAAGVRRPELHQGTPTRKPLTWHDLRATGITWMAVRGDDPLKCRQRAGHTTFQTTEAYIREAEAIREGFGDVFPPLPDVLLGVSDRVSDSDSPERRNPLFSRASGCEGRDLNSPASAQKAERIQTVVEGEAPPQSERAPASPTLAVPSPPPAAPNPEPPTDADLERAIVDAIRLGLGEVARTLATQLDERRRARAGNVVPLATRRRREA